MPPCPTADFIVTWTNDGSLDPAEVDDDDSDAVLARRFDATVRRRATCSSSTPAIPTPTRIDPAVAANRHRPGVHRLGGRPHLSPERDTDPDGIRGRAFLATTDIVNGTEGEDIIQTYSLGEPINGLGGDD